MYRNDFPVGQEIVACLAECLHRICESVLASPFHFRDALRSKSIKTSLKLEALAGLSQVGSISFVCRFAISTGGHGVLLRCHEKRLMPRANIPEYRPLNKPIKKATSRNWPTRKKVALFLLWRGVRGQPGVRISAGKIFKRQWNPESAHNVKAFGEHMLRLETQETTICPQSCGGPARRPQWSSFLANLADRPGD